MKYIKKLNIDFDQWDELKLSKCTYLIFKSGYSYRLYIGYIGVTADLDKKLAIIKKSNKYQIILLNDNDTFNLNILQNFNEIPSKQTNIHYKLSNTILYEDLIKTDFYKNNKILIVGIDVNKEDILKNPELYVNNNKCKTNFKYYDIY
jgi:hypothetical protein